MRSRQSGLGGQENDGETDHLVEMSNFLEKLVDCEDTVLEINGVFCSFIMWHVIFSTGQMHPFSFTVDLR